MKPVTHKTETAGRCCLDRLVGRRLELTLKKKWFDMIASGEKREEYRAPSPWILSRLENKQYDSVRFRNGYAPNAPQVVCEYKGYELGFGKLEWGAGFDMLVVIRLGRVIESPNDQAH